MANGKSFKRVAAQGELLLTKISSLPKGLKSVRPEKGKLIVGHSETGHHHVIDAKDARLFRDPKNMDSLFAEILRPTQLTHMRDFDTHEPLNLDTGDIIQIRTGQEFDMNAWRKSAD